MEVSCPTSEADPAHHQPFPQGMVYIAGVENVIQVNIQIKRFHFNFSFFFLLFWKMYILLRVFLTIIKFRFLVKLD